MANILGRNGTKKTRIEHQRFMAPYKNVGEVGLARGPLKARNTVAHMATPDGRNAAETGSNPRETPSGARRK